MLSYPRVASLPHHWHVLSRFILRLLLSTGLPSDIYARGYSLWSWWVGRFRLGK